MFHTKTIRSNSRWGRYFVEPLPKYPVFSHRWVFKIIFLCQNYFDRKKFFLHFSGHLKMCVEFWGYSFSLLGNWLNVGLWEISGVSYQRIKCISGLDFRTLGNSQRRISATELLWGLLSGLEDTNYPLWIKCLFRFGSLLAECLPLNALLCHRQLAELF